MPNWCQQDLTITGDAESIAELKTQLSRPYDNGNGQTFEGKFLLWNIVAPTNLDAYHQRVTIAPKENNDPVHISQALSEAFISMNISDADMAKAMAEIAVGEDWYNWNIRNLGTKWEITDSAIEVDEPTKVKFMFNTAWSPIEEALDKLAMQYPTLTFTLRGLDEGFLFACEIHWANGKQTFDCDLPINHSLLMDFYGACHICDFPFAETLDLESQSVEDYKKFGCIISHFDVPDDLSGLEK
jgi:Ferredoxin-like domain in Api92-like protein